MKTLLILMLPLCGLITLNSFAHDVMPALHSYHQSSTSTQMTPLITRHHIHRAASAKKINPI